MLKAKARKRRQFDSLVQYLSAASELTSKSTHRRVRNRNARNILEDRFKNKMRSQLDFCPAEVRQAQK